MKKLLPAITLFCYALVCTTSVTFAQSIGTFNTVEPTAQVPGLVIPATHTFQRIIRTGDALTLGGTLGNNPDFTGYVPIAGSSTNGYLSISGETAPAECAILTMSFDNTSKLWAINSSGKVNLPGTEIGLSAAFCSGTVTAKNTVIVGEELLQAGDFNGDGYDDLGWLVEIDPATRTVINQDGIAGADKLWAMGRQAHENVVINKDQSIAYWGADNAINGFIYKFIPTVPGNFSAGNLYVLETTGLGSGTWGQVANTTRSERNNTVGASTAAGAFNFQRIEDVEIGPDGKIYFASTATGRVYRFSDAGSTVNNLEVFVDNVSYDVDGAGPFAPVKFEWPDNLAFDGEGNLWVLEDGGEYHIWVVSPTHTAAAPAIRVFANTPVGTEPTGITFSPDSRFLFISLMHPSTSNTGTQTDAAGNNVIFNAPTTLVIARKENLGATTLSQANLVLGLLQKNNGIEISWAAGSNTGLPVTIERSLNGVDFTTIASVSNNTATSYLDNNLPPADRLYYRLSQCDTRGECTFSEIKNLKVSGLPNLKVQSLSRDREVRVLYNAGSADDIIVSIYNSVGSQVYTEQRRVNAGPNRFAIRFSNPVNGMYVLKVNGENTTVSRSFVK